MARGKAAEARRRGRRKRNPLVTFMVIAVPATIVALPTVVLVFVGFLPTLAAYAADRGPERAAATTVGAMNFAGVLPFAIALWRGGHSMDALGQILGSPMAWLGMYGAAGVGWTLNAVIPALVATIIVARAQSGIERAKRRRQELLEEWGSRIAESES